MVSALLIFATVGIVSADDPSVGTWKINIEKSKLQDPARWKGGTSTVTLVKEGTYHYTWSYADGRKTEETRIYDGKERPDGEKGITQIDESKNLFHHRTIVKRDGKQIASIEGTISPDGKTKTVVAKGVDANGQPWEEIRVWEKE